MSGQILLLWHGLMSWSAWYTGRIFGIYSHYKKWSLYEMKEIFEDQIVIQI